MYATRLQEWLQLQYTLKHRQYISVPLLTYLLQAEQSATQKEGVCIDVL